MIATTVPVEPSGRSTRAVVDLDAIANNIRLFRRSISPSSRIMAVVKANGYGHGAVMVARTVLNVGADELAVATVDEGRRLRAAGLSAPILVMGPIHEDEIPAALAANLAVVVADEPTVVAIGNHVSRWGVGPALVHLKVDTGMRRFGTTPETALALARRIASSPALVLAGVFSHFARADEADPEPTDNQHATFDRILCELIEAGIAPGLRHIANSAGTLRGRDYDYDMVRIGIALYGLAPSSDVGLWPGMRQAMTIHSRVHRVIDLHTGDGVSYGATYRARSAEQAALVPIGYADGYSRSLSNRGMMEIAERLAPVRGRVCMDQTIVGIAPEMAAAPGDNVIVIGDGRSAAPSLDDVAEQTGTISYEVVTSIAARVPRHYLVGGKTVAIEDLSGLHHTEE